MTLRDLFRLIDGLDRDIIMYNLSDFHGTYDVFPSESFNGDHLVTETTYNTFTIDMRNNFYARDLPQKVLLTLLQNCQQ